jgi:hypothetical protein
MLPKSIPTGNRSRIAAVAHRKVLISGIDATLGSVIRIERLKISLCQNAVIGYVFLFPRK